MGSWTDDLAAAQVLVTSPVAGQLLRSRVEQVLLGHDRQVRDSLQDHLVT